MTLAKHISRTGNDHGLFKAASFVAAICVASVGTLAIMACGLVSSH